MAFEEQSGSRQPIYRSIDRVIDSTTIRPEVLKSRPYGNVLIAVGNALEITGWNGDRANWEIAEGKYRFVGDAFRMVMWSDSYRNDGSPGVEWFLDRDMFRERRDMNGYQNDQQRGYLQQELESVLQKEVDSLAFGPVVKMSVWNSSDVRFGADQNRLGVWAKLGGANWSVPFRREDYSKYSNPLHVG